MNTVEPIKTGLCLRVLEGAHSEAVHPLGRSIISIGRASPENPYSPSYLTFPEPTLSRLHALLTWEAGAKSYMIHHRSQTNPSVLNGKSLTRSELLKPGDIFCLGRLVLLLEERKTEDLVLNRPKEGAKLFLNIKNSGEEHDRVFRVPVEKSRLLLRFDASRKTAAMAAEVASDQSQLVSMTAEQHQEFRFNFSHDTNAISLEVTTSSSSVAYRKSVLAFGVLSCPLRLASPVPFGKNDVLSHQGFQIWLSASDAHPPGSTPEEKAMMELVLTRPGPGHCVLSFLNGAWKGAYLELPARGATSLEIGPQTTSFGHPLPYGKIPTVRLSMQDGTTQARVVKIEDDQFVDINGDLLFFGESAPLFSGSRFLLGGAEFFWSVPSLHQQYSRYQIMGADGPHPIEKAQVRLGTAAHCEVRFAMKSLAPVLGILRYDHSGFTYLHTNIACPARIDGIEASAGLESPLTKNSNLELAPGVTVHLREIY